MRRRPDPSRAHLDASPPPPRQDDRELDELVTVQYLERPGTREKVVAILRRLLDETGGR